jgi:hypothetical protein
MASALSKGSFGGTACDYTIICSTYAGNLLEVCLVGICSFPLCVGGTGGAVVWGFLPLVEGGSASTVMGWSSVTCIGGSVRSIRFRVGVIVCWYVRGCVCGVSFCEFCPSNRVARSICIC